MRPGKWLTTFFGFFLATLIISVSKDLVINRHWPSAVNLGFHAFLAAVCVSAIIVRRRRYQEIMGIAGAAALSPHALFIAAGIGRSLVAMAPDGRRAWSHPAGGKVVAIACRE